MKVIYKGFLDLRRVLDTEDYERSKLDFASRGIELMNLADINVWERRDTRILLSDFVIQIEDENKLLYNYTYKPGYITDLASVPPIFRSSVDNDRLEMLLPALVHDANFACHYLLFKEANKLFGDMILAVGGSRWLSAKSWLAVSNPIGRKRYNQNTQAIQEKVKQFVSMEKYY